jgi:hypothetical protein
MSTVTNVNWLGHLKLLVSALEKGNTIDKLRIHSFTTEGEEYSVDVSVTENRLLMELVVPGIGESK